MSKAVAAAKPQFVVRVHLSPISIQSQFLDPANNSASSSLQARLHLRLLLVLLSALAALGQWTFARSSTPVQHISLRESQFLP